MKKYIFLILCAATVSSCSENSKNDLTGTWEIDELKITINSVKNSTQNQVIEASAANWEEKMQSRNIQTTYHPNGTYNSLHKDLKDSVTYNPAGTWKMYKNNDSMVIEDTFPVRNLYKYRIKMTENTAEFWSTEDFDKDGKIDDEYYSKQRKIK